MAGIKEKICEQALDLPIEDRLNLIEKLLESTNLPTQKHIDQTWAEEVELRAQALDKGKAGLIPGEEVFGKIKEIFSE